MAEDEFTIHKITDEQRKMLEIRIALTQQLRALTAHLYDSSTVTDAYNKLVDYLRKYRARSDVEEMRAMVAKRTIGDKTITEHLHALRLQFGTKPATLPILRRIFEDSLAPTVAFLLSAERINVIDSYADCANELYILCEPFKRSAIAAIEPEPMSNQMVSTVADSLTHLLRDGFSILTCLTVLM